VNQKLIIIVMPSFEVDYIASHIQSFHEEIYGISSSV